MDEYFEKINPNNTIRAKPQVRVVKPERVLFSKAFAMILLCTLGSLFGLTLFLYKKILILIKKWATKLKLPIA